MHELHASVPALPGRMTYYCRWAVAEATSGWYKLGNDLRCSFRWAGWMGEVGGFGVQKRRGVFAADLVGFAALRDDTGWSCGGLQLITHPLHDVCTMR
jgi:hypothetical protein